MKRFTSIIVLIFLMLAISSCLSDDFEKSKGITSAKTQVENKSDTTKDKPVPEIDFKLKTLSGKEIKLSDLKGKIVVINFFTVNCPYCKVEMPYFIKATKDYSDKNVAFLFIDTGDSSDKVKTFLKSNSFEIDPLLDLDAKVYSAYGVRGVPTTIIINKDGNIFVGNTGVMEESDLRSTLDNIIKK